jgi:hypothetical protein
MCFKINFFFAQNGVNVLQILTCFILHRRRVQKFGRSFFFMCSHVHTLILLMYDADLVYPSLFLFAYIVNFYKKKQFCTLHLVST